jgi:hypothetical protein
MPAGFNKGQIEYIKTIANVNGHKTYKVTTHAGQQHTVEQGVASSRDGLMKFKLFSLGPTPITLKPASPNDPSTGNHSTPLDVYNIPINSDQAAATAQQRVTPECFFESVNCKLRLVSTLDETIDEQSHKEYRLIVFRHKEKQHHILQNAENFSNPLYDMFWGAGNVKYGPEGYRRSHDDHGDINYVDSSSYDAAYDRDAMMTDPMNKDDYVVMKDCRFYLGREYGGKHIYEDRFHWDHEDPIATDNADLTTVDSNKNYCWYIYLACVNNDTRAVGQSGLPNTPTDLGYIRLALHTHVTSG